MLPRWANRPCNSILLGAPCLRKKNSSNANKWDNRHYCFHMIDCSQYISYYQFGHGAFQAHQRRHKDVVHALRLPSKMKQSRQQTKLNRSTVCLFCQDLRIGLALPHCLVDALRLAWPPPATLRYPSPWQLPIEKPPPTGGAPPPQLYRSTSK